MDYKIDLHVHSYMSDGADSPEEVIETAAKKNVKAVALTDHDSIEGVGEARAAALKYNVDFLNGIEISSIYENGRILHILGLGIDIDNKDFLKAYIKMKKARENGIPQILDIIKEKGVPIDIEVLRKNAVNRFLDRYDIHRYFVKNHLCSSSQEIWDKYLDPIPYGEDELIKAEDAIDIIHKAGGLSFLAHYNKKIGLKGFTRSEVEEHIKYLISLGLNGLEKYYPSYETEDTEFLDYLINKYNLLASGGTDFHGKNRPGIDMGTGKGDLFIPYTLYDTIVNKIEKQI